MLTRRTLIGLGLAATSGVLAACRSTSASRAHTATVPTASAPTATATATLPVIARAANERVLIVGDSLTFGEGASRPNVGYAFSTVMGLRARGKGAGKYYLLHGISGITAGGMLSFMDVMDSGETADLVIVELGTNDTVGGTQLSDFAVQYTRLMEQLRAASPTAHIVALTCWRDPAFVTKSSHPASAYNAIITDTVAHAISGPRRTIDLAPLYLTPWYHHASGDTFHPNDDGHAAIAQTILSVV